MSEKDLGDALLRGEDPIDLQALTQAVLQRDRRRMWTLGIVCFTAWMAFVALPWATIMPMMARIGQYQVEVNRAKTAPTAEEREAESIEVLKAIKLGTLATFVASILSMFVAALSTVTLIILSRRATLRQVNVRLAEISAQLKTLARESK
jgi:hypothetical protein